MGKETHVTHVLDTAFLEEHGQLKSLLYNNSSAIGLEDLCLVEDDAPAIGQPQGTDDRSWFEKLHQGIIVRKDLILEDVRSFTAHLVFVGVEADDNDFPLYIRINGVDIVRPPSKIAHPSARQYYTNDWGGSHFDNWFVVEVPVKALRSGNNEILLWTESEKNSWEIMIAADEEFSRGSQTRSKHPNRSAKSIDGGKSWDFDHLGWKNEIDGEYCIRLSLGRHASEGIYISPVIDLAGETRLIKQNIEVVKSRINWKMEIPEGCIAEIRMRLGNSPVLNNTDWSDYTEVNDCVAVSESCSIRYMQFEIVMGTNNPLVTPKFLSVSIESSFVEQRNSDGWIYKIERLDNGRVVRSSMEYTYENFANLNELREDFELDKIVAGASNEFEAQLRLMSWAYRVPLSPLNPYAWNYYDILKAKRDDKGRIILHQNYNKRRRDGHCLYCNLSLVAACTAMGYPARWVNISSKHTYGHEVAEVWSNEFNKWVFMDSTRDYYIYDPDTGIPLSLVEISNRLGEIMPGQATWEFPVQWHLPKKSMLENVRIAYREGDHEYSVLSDEEVEGEDLLMYKGHLQMPLRNDFASNPHPLPWRLSSNWGGDQFFCYYSDMFPRKQEYQRHTKRWQDFNPSLNQAELFLYEIKQAGILRIEIDTETPYLDAFLVQISNGEWQEYKKNTFDWPLSEGLNHLRVKVRNQAGVYGKESYVAIVAHK